MLRLLSVGRAHASLPSPRVLWATVVDISVRLEGVDAFTIDSTTLAGRTGHDAADDARLLRSLGLKADDQRRILHPLAGHSSTLVELETRVLSIDLYAGRAWVSGVSDWGDELDALFEIEAFSELTMAIEGMEATPRFDVIEAGSRPTLPAVTD